MHMDANDFYLNNLMNRSEYIMIQISIIPQKFIDTYNLKYKLHNLYILPRVTKGINGLPQSG